MRKPMQSAYGKFCASASFLAVFVGVQQIKSGLTRVVAAACLLLSFALAPAAFAATSAKHEMTSNWVGSPASAPYGSALTAEWHINTNDANNPQANNPVNNVRLTLTATNGVFANMPAICKTTGVTPPSAISANGTQLLCNLGTVTEGTSTVVQTQILPNGVVGSTLSVTGSVTSDSASAPTAPTAPSGLPITGSHGMDLAIGAPNQNYQQNTIASRSGGNRPSIMVDYGISMTAGSIPGPSTYTFTLDIAVSVAGQLPGLQWEGCAPIDDTAQAPGIPHSATSFTDRTNFPTCTISGSGTHYTVTLSGLDYSLQHVPTVDSLYQAIPSATNFIAAGQLIFSYTTPITATTGVTFGATPTPFTFIDNVTQPETNTGNNVSGTTLVIPGVFSMIWMGSPSAGRVPWDANMWAAPGAAQNRVFPWPAAGSSTNPGPYSLSDQPLGAQADSVTWSTYSGPGGPDMAGSCVLIQNPAAFTPRWLDFLAADGASYSNMPTAHLWYRTDTLNTKTATCGEPVGVAGSPWISAPLPAGCATQTASISPAYSDDQCIVSVPPGVTAVKMTWNPAVDKQFHHFLRVWGYVPTTAPIGAESWVAGTFNAPYNTATVFPGYPTLNNYINISTSPAVTGTIPGSTYGPNTNGIRDAMRIQGPNGAITKTASNPSALPGVPVTFTLSAEADLATVNPPAQTFTVVDTLPTGMTYVTGSGTPVPVLSVNGSGQQVLTYTFTNVPANVAQPITYQAQTAANSSITPGTVLTNTAQINVVGDNRAVAAKQVTASLTVPNNGATTLAKSVDSNLLSFLGDSSAWNLTINSQDSVSNSFTDTIDILPYAGDGRGTNISGTYTIGAVTAAGATVYYTTTNPSTLSNDPRAASNGTAPGSIAGNSVGWTTTKPAAPTAIRVIGPALAPGASQTIRIAFTTPAGTSCAAPAPTDNKPGQLLVNSANSIAAHTGLPMLSSSTTTIGSCYSLALTKALTTNRFAAGDQFTVAIRTGSASGTVVNSTANSTTAGTGSTLTGGFGTTGAYSGTAANTAYFLTESGAGTPAAVLGNYTSTITCTDTNGVQTGLPNNQPYSTATGFSITPVLGAVISCTIANTAVPSITVQKQVTSRILAGDQFTVALKNSGGTVLTSATTSGTGNTVTTVNWPVTQGATYTITDAMAAGSPNTLGAYVPSASCVNTTTGNAVTVGGAVGAWTVTGGSPGDAYVCTVINSPGPPIACNANPNIFNTGYNAGTGGILPDNSFDAHWQVAGPFPVTTPGNAVSMPPANAVWAAANVGNMAPTAWSASPYGNAQWISQQTIANPNSPDGDWYYRYQFTMDPAVDPTSFSLAMNFLSDNNVMEVYVNGVAQSSQTTGLPQATSVPDPYQGTGYLTANAASTTLNHNWQTGLNTIIVQIKSGRPVEGFDAQVRPSSLCPAHVAIKKSTPATTVTPSGQIVYTIVASNTGASSAAGTVVADPIPTGIASQTWTCSASGGAVCPNASGTGALSQTLATFPGGGAVTYTVTGTVSSNPPAHVTNTATASPPPGSLCTPTTMTPPCNSTVTVPPVPQVSIQKSTLATTLTPNGTVAYTIVASNTGTVDASGTQVSDPIPAGVTSQTWTCAASGGAACPNASGTGALSETLATFPVNGSVTYTVTATISANPPAHVTNTATATPPTGGICTPGNTQPPCTSTVTVPPIPQVSITKTANTQTLTPGGTIVYTVVASNGGSVDAGGAQVSDPIPAGITAVSWTCAATGGAVCPNANGTGALNQTIGTFPAGSSVTYTLTATVSANPPAHVTNTATVTTTGLCLPNNTPPPCSGIVVTPPVPQVSITKTANTQTLTPGGTIVYTVVASNGGSVDAGGAQVSDPIPTGITAVSWTCSAAGGAICPNTSGTGALNQTIATFPAGSSLTYTLTATVSANPPAHVTNTATVTTTGLCLPNNTPPPCSGIVVTPPVPQVSITKTANTQTLTPGGTIVYTVVASNGGSVDAGGAQVSDPIPAGITAVSWTCAANGGAVCPNASGSGALNETIATFPVGSNVTYTLTATVSANPPAHVTNTATVTTTGLCLPNNTPPPCSGIVVTPPLPQVSITKTANTQTLTPGGTIVYTVVASNGGSVDAGGAQVSDPIPAGITAVSWTCAANGGAVCPNANGTGALSQTIATFPPGSSVTYTLTATVSANPPAQVTNTATVTTTGLCLPNNTPPPCSGIVVTPPLPQVSITKTANTQTLTPGGTIVYTVVASNGGAVDASGAQVSDPIPAGITAVSWTCSAAGGAVCPNASGSGALNQTIATFPAGSSLTYTLTATVSANPPAHVTNTATITTPTPSLCLPNNTPPPCEGIVVTPPIPQVSITKTANTQTLTPGGTIVYTVVASNGGAVDAGGAQVSDPTPAGITAVSWTCSATGGAVCPSASGTGALNQTVATFPAGSSLTYTLTATVSANPPAHVTNTATITTPTPSLCLPNNTPPPCEGIVVTPPIPQVSITKTANTQTLTPGGTIVYTVVANNGGAVDASGAQVSDPIPAGITAVSWTCAANGGAVCPNASGTGALNQTIATFPAGGSLTYRLTATVSANPPAHVTNTATITTPTPSLCLPNNTPPPCEGIVVTPPIPQVSVTKTANTQTLTPGGTIVYTVVASNGGSVDASGAQVSDPIPAGITAVSWTCSATGGAVCPNARGSGALNETIATFPAGSSLTYTLTATVSANPPAHVTNTATLTTPTPSLCLPNNTPPPCSGIVVTPPIPQVSITKTANTQTLTPGGTIVYTVVASNGGSVDAGGAQVSDPIPAGITAVSWTCAASGGAVCPNASGSGALNETIATFPAGSSLTYTLTATVSANPPAHVTNTATITTPTPSLCLPNNTPPPCSGIVVTPPLPQVSITKTANTQTLTPGGTIVYTVVANNGGAVDASGAQVSDPIPTGITAVSWTCVANGGAVCPNASGNGALNETIATFPAGSSLTYTLTATVSANPPAHVTNTATLTTPTPSLCLPNNTPPPCSGIVVTPPLPQVSITKTANTQTLTPGGTIVYTVVASNGGAVDASGAQVSDPIPAGITAVSWTCAANGGAVCPNASGSGALNETIATFPAGSSLTYTLTATVSANPPAHVTNTATITTPTPSLCLPNNTPPPCEGIVVTPPIPQVSITKTANTQTLTPGGTIVYTVVASNGGAVDASGAQVSDPIPAGITAVSWTCAANGGAVCPNASGNGALNQTIATFPAGSSLTYTLTATVSANPPAHVTNTATITTPTPSLCLPNNTPPPCSGIVVTPPLPQVSITKTANTQTLTPGGTIVYTVVASNGGAVDASGAQVSDPIPAGITAVSWTCSAAGGAVCPNASGTGALSQTIATFPAGSSLTYTLTATVSANPPAHVTNTATITTPTPSLCLPNNTPPPCSGIVVTPPVPQVSITKTANTQTLTPGGTIVYTVVASNGGAVDASGAQVSDPIPAGIAAVSWTCSAAGGAVCPNASGTGALNQTIATFPAGGSLTYTLTATVSANPPAHVTNTATITTPTPSLCLPNNTPPPCSGIVVTPPIPQVSITKTANTQTLTPGGTIVYTVVASNGGAVDASGAQVSDPIPAGITAVSWTCSAAGGAVCPNASGTGALNQTVATFPAGSSLTYTLTATVSANPPAHVTNTATITTPTPSLCLPNNTPPPCSGIVVTPPVPQVSITKTANTQTLTPGGTIVYTVVASNGGSVDAGGAQVSDPIPAGIAAVSWTCAANGGAVCPSASGTGALNQTIATFPAGSSLTYTLTATVSANPPAHVTNTATVTTTGLCLPNNTPPPCSGIVVTPPVPQVSITKTANTQTLTPGGTIVYTVVASNGGTVSANGTQVSDPIASGLTAYSTTCAASGGAVCPNGAGPNPGALNETIATFPPGSSVVYTITATVSNAPSGAVTNTASLTPPTGSLCLPNNIPPPCSGSTTSSPPNAFDPPFITKAVTVVDTQTLRWTIVVDNNQNLAAQNLEIRDPMPTSMSFASGTLTCTAFGASTISKCTFDAANNRIVVDALMQSDLGVASPATAPNRIMIDFSARYVTTPVAVTNTALACWDAHNSTTNVTACQQTVQGSAQYTPSAPPTPPVPAPMDSRWMLWLMMVMLAYPAIRGLRRK